ncbi:hypothetical protein VNO77_04232 [Canavalia gladiata]|uniref:Uncharacterized protein n=1 Tax=Canavalia gladiata TaxID=3824 RepID=A0AAN9MX06_CANGL
MQEVSLNDSTIRKSAIEWWIIYVALKLNPPNKVLWESKVQVCGRASKANFHALVDCAIITLLMSSSYA